MRRYIPLIVTVLAWATAAGATTVDFNDAKRGEQWYLDAMRFPEAWGLIYNLPQRAVVRSAVLDSGFDRGHEELSEHTYKGYNIASKTPGVHAAASHGTATLGVMAASSGNGKGITRAAFTSPVLPVQITNRADGGALVNDMLTAIIYAVDKGARVINLSYTGVQLNIMAEAALYAKRHGAVVFMAAGNDGKTHADWANHNWLVAVGSVNHEGEVSSFSSKGKFVDFVAPGESILTTQPGNGYAKWSGTSFASPLAASVASLMLTANPELSAGQVIKILRATATDIGPEGRDDASGYGLLNAEAAVAMAINTKGNWPAKKQKRPILWTSVDLSGVRGLELSAGLLQPITPVPEPGAGLLLLAAVCVMLPRRRLNVRR